MHAFRFYMYSYVGYSYYTYVLYAAHSRRLCLNRCMPQHWSSMASSTQRLLSVGTCTFLSAVLLLSLCTPCLGINSDRSGGVQSTSQCLTIQVSDCSPSTCAEHIITALENCADAGGGTVTLGEGTFVFADAGSEMKWVFNLGNNVRNVALQGAPLDSFGQPRTRLSIEGRHGFFSLHSTASVSVSRVSLSTARPCVTLGRVVAVSENNFTVAVSDDALFPFPQPLPPGSWLASVAAIMGFDTTQWRIAQGAVDIYENHPLVVHTAAGAGADELLSTHRGNGTVLVTVLGLGSSRDGRIAVGGDFVLRHTTYGWDGFNLQNATNTTLEDVVMECVCGMGVYASDSRDVALRRVALRRPDGIPMSATADATHFNSVSGDIVLENTTFEGQGDDGINVHGAFHDVRDVMQWSTLGADGGHSAAGTLLLGSRPAGGITELRAGDVYVFRDRRTWAVQGSARLKEVVNTSAVTNTQVGRFETAAGEAFVPSRFALLTNPAREPDSVTIRRAYFGQNRARGALLKVSDVLVEDSVFDHPADHCVQAFPDGCFWFESGAFSRWVLRNNTFRGCLASAMRDVGDYASADVFIAACAPDWNTTGSSGDVPLPQGHELSTGQPFGDIGIESNTFEQDRPHPAVLVFGADGLNIANNTVHLEPPENLSNGHTSDDTLKSSLDGFIAYDDGGVELSGWVVDDTLGGKSSNVTLFVDGRAMLTALADNPRPDLVPVVAPEPQHGFNLRVQLPRPLPGNHTLAAVAVRGDGTTVQLNRSPMCANAWRRTCHFPTDCSCGGAHTPVQWFRVSNSLRCAADDNGMCPDGQPCTVSVLDNTTCHL